MNAQGYIKRFNYQINSLFLSIGISFWYPVISLLLITCNVVYCLSKHTNSFYSKNNLHHRRIYLFTLFILFLYELLSFFISIYRDNSTSYLVLVVYCMLLSVYCSHIFSQDIQLYFKISSYIYIYGTILASLTIIYYLSFINNVFKNGFTEFTSLRNLYLPFRKLSNDWVSILFCFLPFSTYQYLLKSEIGWSKNLLTSSISVMIICFSILISFSRGAYLALFLFWVVSISIMVRFKIINMKVLAFKMTYMFSILILLSSLIYTPLKETVSLNATTSHERSTEGRKKIWGSGIAIFKENLMVGIGSNNFSIYYNKYRNTGEDNTFTGRVSNSLIQLLIEKGIIGFVIYVNIFIVYLFYCFKKLKSVLNNQVRLFIALNASLLISLIIRDFTFSSIFSNSGILTILFFAFAFNTAVIKNDERHEFS